MRDHHCEVIIIMVMSAESEAGWDEASNEGNGNLRKLSTQYQEYGDKDCGWKDMHTEKGRRCSFFLWLSRAAIAPTTGRLPLLAPNPYSSS